MTYGLWRMTGCLLSLEMVRRKGKEEEVQMDIIERVDSASDVIKGKNIAKYLTFSEEDVLLLGEIGTGELAK
jgi:hypothetical protein